MPPMAEERAKGMRETANLLRGCRVMIVEDEMLIAMELESIVADQGGTVIGPAPNIERALALLDRERPDAAILDVNLNGSTVAPVAAALTEQGVPFVLATGYGKAPPPEMEGVPLVQKPVNHAQLVRALVGVLEASGA
jgi:two-component SAPR family response regulator